MREKEQTSEHLLLAGIVTIFGVLLILITIAMSWETWMIPVILAGNTLVWGLHIGRAGSGIFYENLCAVLLMIGFFFFGVHSVTLFDIPAVACMILIVFSMFYKKRLLYMVFALYVVVLLYHFFILHTIGPGMGIEDILRLGVDAMVMAGVVAIAKYWIKKRRETRELHDSTFAKLEKAGRQNAEFLSNVSHELRTPINMVLGISEVILEEDLPSDVREEVQSIWMAGRRLSDQISNMLDYTEIVEGTLVPVQKPYMVTSAVNDIIAMHTMQNGGQQLEMVFDIDPNIPAVLVGDVEKISHVIKILLENSIKFTEEGGINICLGYRRESYGINLLIDIYDTGIGMTESQLAQICDDFYQADSGSSRFAGGLGIGLPIAQGLLHAMGGFIYFESKEQQGLQVHMSIPQGVEDDTPAVALSDPGRLCIACYFRPEKYANDEVRRYYDNMILHMVEGLGVEGYQAHNFDGLQKLQRSHALTHVFIAQAQYEENRSYYEELAGDIQVVAIVDRDFMLERDSRLLVIRKPFFVLSIVNLLNGEERANGYGEAQAAGRRPFSCEGVRVLAVDDEEMNLVVAKGVLGSYGMQVDTCRSGKEAVRRCAAVPYDIVFLDHMMPGFDGVETLRQLREIDNGSYRERPVIALTANTISGAREMFQNEGFTEFVPKPIERTVLERVLRKVLPEHCVQYDTAPAAPGDLITEKDALTGNTLEKAAAGEILPKTAVLEMPVSEKEKPKGFVSEKEQPDMPTLERKKAGGFALDMSTQEKEDPKGFVLEKEQSKTPAPEKKKAGGFALDMSAQEKEDPKGFVLEKEQPKTSALEKKGAEGFALDMSARKKGGQKGFGLDMPVSEKGTGGTEVSEESAHGEGVQESPVPPGVPHVPAAALSRIGVNVQLGLDYCCGEEDFYLEMLQMFSSQAEEKKEELIALYNEANWEDYAVKVHALKSTSMTIGAERLAEQARMLEQAGKKKNVEYIQRYHPILLRLYDEICGIISGS